MSAALDVTVTDLVPLERFQAQKQRADQLQLTLNETNEQLATARADVLKLVRERNEALRAATYMQKQLAAASQQNRSLQAQLETANRRLEDMRDAEQEAETILHDAEVRDAPDMHEG